MLQSKAVKIFAENMRKRRKSLHISQEELGQMCGLHRTYIGGIEQFIRNPSMKSMEKIAHALNTEISLLTNEHYDEIMASDYSLCNFKDGKFSYCPISADDIDPKYLEELDQLCAAHNNKVTGFDPLGL